MGMDGCGCMTQYMTQRTSKVPQAPSHPPSLPKQPLCTNHNPALSALSPPASDTAQHCIPDQQTSQSLRQGWRWQARGTPSGFGGMSARRRCPLGQSCMAVQCHGQAPRCRRSRAGFEIHTRSASGPASLPPPHQQQMQSCCAWQLQLEPSFVDRSKYMPARTVEAGCESSAACSRAPSRTPASLI